MKAKKEYRLSIIAGLILVFLGIFYQLYLTEGTMPLIFINAGTILIVIAILKHNKYGAGIKQDERTRKLGAKALSNSWLVTFLLINMLYWINYTSMLVLTTNAVLGILLFTMTLSAGIFQFLLKRKGVINED